jgi:hypothetical protein
MTVKFSGENGKYFYSLVQKKLIDWCIFDLSCTNLGRFDFYYFQKSNPIDQDDFPESFLENSCEKVNSKSKRKKTSWKRTPRGLIMRIGNRSNSNYSRLYQKTKKINHGVYDEMNRGFKFELELKNQLVKSFQKFLFNNHLEEFEGRLVEHFYKHYKKCFVLDTCYTDWLKTLREESWIAINRSKRGPTNHKAFLTKEGKKIIQDRKKDFEFFFLIKEPSAYVFTSEVNHYQKLRREAITKDVNKIMRAVSNQLSGQPNVTSHSFRIGYITQLWKDSKDIEFVKQTIGHQRLDTTSAYVNKLSDQERRERISELNQMCSEKGLGFTLRPIITKS